MGKLKEWILAQSESMIDPADECLSDEGDYDDSPSHVINDSDEQPNPMKVMIHPFNQPCGDENSDEYGMF
jgi:hypothetical protein